MLITCKLVYKHAMHPPSVCHKDTSSSTKSLPLSLSKARYIYLKYCGFKTVLIFDSDFVLLEVSDSKDKKNG